MKSFKLKLITLLIIAAAVGFFGVSRVWGEMVALDWARPVGGNDESVNDPEIIKINNDIAAKQQAIESLRRQQAEYQRIIAAKQAEKASLNNQLTIFDNRLASLQASLEKIQLNIEETQLEIKKLDLEIANQESQINREKEQIAFALGLLYKEDNKSDIEIMLTKENFVEYLDQVKHLKDLNKGINDSLEKLKRKQVELVTSREAQKGKQESLQQMRLDLDHSREDIRGERSAKEIVLDRTKASEAEYQKFLAQAKKEEQAAAADIANLEKTVRKKLAGDQRFDSLSIGDFTWPVPKNTITAYFHDPDYPFRNVFEHPAVDIRAAQGTTIRAAAAGYVARAHDAGLGYSYIMLVHSNGLSTVYGHVSAIYVKEDQYVTQGQAIGLSGGMPGTRGAGKLTTGPHLHFETRMNGIPVNPLDYLP